MNVLKKLEVLTSTIPQLYSASNGSNEITFRSGGEVIKKYSFRAFTPNLATYKTRCLYLINDLESQDSAFASSKSEENRLREKFALIWLNIKTRLEIEDLNKILDYFYELSNRTNENSFISKSILVDSTLDSSELNSECSLDNSNIDKAIDLVASSPYTYLHVSKDLKIKKLESLSLTGIEDTTSYKFIPEFIHILSSVTSEDRVLFTITGRGDLIVCHCGRMIASKRRDRWTIYEPETFKNTLTAILPDYWIACNAYEFIFDLSYKRHGALVVFDSEDNFSNYVEQDEQIKQIFEVLIPDYSLGDSESSISNKRKLLELSSVDGAMIADSTSGNILGFGKIIKTHPDCPGQLGARTTAGLSAVLYGGKAIKVSADGDITIWFKTAWTGDEINKISFL